MFEFRWGESYLSVCRKEQRDPHWLYFREMTHLGFLQKIVEAFKV
jgi:hypothetical protein